MNPKIRQYIPGRQSLSAALAITALAAIGMPGTASANSTKDTTIINVATVTYSDIANSGNWSAHAASKVTVNLVAAAPTLYNAPSGGAEPGSPDCPTVANYPSGSTVTRVYALAANANGSDTYNLSVVDYAADTANLTSSNRTISTLNPDGTVDVAGAASRVLGSAIPIGIFGSDTLQFPGGALASQNITDGDIVLVEIGPLAGPKVKKLFKVLSKVDGVAPSHSYADGAPHTDTGATVVAETIGSLQLEAYNDYTLYGQTFGGGATIPAFGVAATAPTLGVPVGEAVLLKIDTTATTSLQSPSVLATAGFQINTGDPAPKTCKVDHFQAPTLNITKKVRNVTAGGVFAGNLGVASGAPGEILEYQIVVSNAGVQAGSVKIDDAVPAYTTLVAYTGAYGTGTQRLVGTAPAAVGSDNFARLTDSAGNTLDLDIQTTAETQPSSGTLTVNTGYGRAGGTATASPLNFYLGAGSNNATPAGGTVPSCSTGAASNAAACTALTTPGTWLNSYTILYQVKID